MMMGRPGIFAGGDLVPCERTVTVAGGGGKKAACNIDGWLRSTAYAPPPKHTIVTFGTLNLPIFSDRTADQRVGDSRAADSRCRTESQTAQARQ